MKLYKKNPDHRVTYWLTKNIQNREDRDSLTNNDIVALIERGWGEMGKCIFHLVYIVNLQKYAHIKSVMFSKKLRKLGEV